MHEMHRVIVDLLAQSYAEIWSMVQCGRDDMSVANDTYVQDVMNLDPQSKVHKTSVSWCEAENNPVTQLVEDVEITLSWSPQWPVLRTESTWDVHGSTQGNNNVPAKGHHSQ
ncbi:hypothetical protein M8J75_000727 [Diaphorina citri]|nr:hypothetical protein M8J75_000727 [Diaphorina citri]